MKWGIPLGLLVACLLGLPEARARAPQCPVSSADNPLKTEADITEENILKIGAALPKGTSDLAVTDIVACFPAEFRKSYVMVYDSKSLQPGEKDSPRVVMYGSSGRALVAFNPKDNELEMIQYGKATPPKTGSEFKPKMIEVTKTGMHSGDTGVCASCHGKDTFRPKFDAYDRWPGVWGSKSSVGKDSISATECKEYKAFLATQKKDPNSPYKVIPLEDPTKVKEDTELGGGCYVKNGATTSPAGQMNHVVSELNIHRVKDEIKGDTSKPEGRSKLNKYRHLWLSAALGCELVKPNTGDGSYFDRAVPEDLRKKADCEGMKKEIGTALRAEFDDQIKQMNVTVCQFPGATPATIQGAGYPYFMVDNNSCGNDPVKCKAACQKILDDIKAAKGAKDPEAALAKVNGIKNLMKAVELPGTIDFENIAAMCCAAKIQALASGDTKFSCKDWSYATRGKSSQSYSMADGLPGIRALMDEIAMDPDFNAGVEQYNPANLEMICCKDVEAYLSDQRSSSKKCRKLDPNKETCEGVRRFIHLGGGTPKNTHNDIPFTASSCNGGGNEVNLGDYQARARACRELAAKSEGALAGRDSGDYSRCPAAYNDPLAKNKRVAEALADQPSACPASTDGSQFGVPAPNAPLFLPADSTSAAAGAVVGNAGAAGVAASGGASVAGAAAGALFAPGPGK
ncbi:MAG: hypothetical protein HY075_16725 [Deltaproteobacteria bacterium]|nr:hypothetical protein [Deltaproteobacteria bacterium]